MLPAQQPQPPVFTIPAELAVIRTPESGEQELLHRFAGLQAALQQVGPAEAAVQFRRISALLFPLAAEMKNERLRRYILAVDSALGSGDFSTAEREWFRDRAPATTPPTGVDIVLLPAATETPAVRAYTILYDPPATLHARQVVQLAARAFDTLPMPAGGGAPPPPEILVADRFNPAQQELSPALFSLLYPTSAALRGKNGPTLIVFRNIHALYFQRVITPVTEAVLPPNWREKVDFPAYFTTELLHRMAHACGPALASGARATPLPVDEALGDVARVIEEIKAGAVTLHAILALGKSGAISAETQDRLLASAMAGWMSQLTQPEAAPTRKAASVLLTYLLKKEGVRFDVTFRNLEPGPARLVPACRELLTQLLAIQHNGNQTTARQFLDQYTATGEIHTLLLEKLGKLSLDLKLPTTIVQ